MFRDSGCCCLPPRGVHRVPSTQLLVPGHQKILSIRAQRSLCIIQIQMKRQQDGWCRDHLGPFCGMSPSALTASACPVGLVTGEVYRAFPLSVAPRTPGQLWEEQGRIRLYIHSSSRCSRLGCLCSVSGLMDQGPCQPLSLNTWSAT